VTPTTPKPRWYYPTPARFFIGLLAVQVFLFLSGLFKWFPFNERKGWTVLIAVGVVGLAVVVMLIWGLVCLCLRRRFQFGVRSLVAFLVVVSVPLGWFAWEVQKARRQREAVAAINRAGGLVFCDHSVPLGWKHEPETPAWARHLLGDHFFCDAVKTSWGKINTIFGSHSLSIRVVEDDLLLLKNLTELRELTLHGDCITDARLEHLRGLTNLKTISIRSTKVTDEGIKGLQQALPNCEIRREPTTP
jgi:hypothetical protein